MLIKLRDCFVCLGVINSESFRRTRLIVQYLFCSQGIT